MRRKITINKAGKGATTKINAPGEGSSVSFNYTGVVATALSKQQVIITWPEQQGAAGYIIFRDTTGAFTNQEQVYAGTDVFFHDTGLSQNTLYYYRVETTTDVIGTTSVTTLNAAVTYDIDTEAAIAAIQADVLLTTPAKVLINDFVTTLKTESLWSKLYTIHLLKFGSVGANSINIVNPDFNMDGFPAIFSGAVVHQEKDVAFSGVHASTEPNATRATACNWFNPFVYMDDDNKGYTFNITAGNSYRFGAYTGSPNVRDSVFVDSAGNDECGLSGLNVTGSNFMTGSLPGSYVAMRRGPLSEDVVVRKNGVDILTSLNGSTGSVNGPISMNGLNFRSTPHSSWYRTNAMDFFASHESFDETETDAWEAAINALITGLDAITITAGVVGQTVSKPSGNDVLRIFGDSFSHFGSPQIESGEKVWVYRLAQRLGLYPFSHAATSAGYDTAVNNCLYNLATPNVDFMAVMVGYNDIKVSLLNAKGIELGKSAIRAMLANHFLATAVAASDAAVTKVGTWTDPVLALSKSGSLGGQCRQSSTSGDKISYTFNGDNVVIGVQNSDGDTVTNGSVDITVDAVPQDSYDANNKAYNVSGNGGVIFNVIILKGFGPGSHTVELTLNANLPFKIDYFGTQRDPSLCRPVLIMDIQHDNMGTPGRNDAMDNMTALTKAEIAIDFPEYSDLIFFGDTNGYYDASDPTQISGDDVHPVAKGHKGIYRDAEKALMI